MSVVAWMRCCLSVVLWMRLLLGSFLSEERTAGSHSLVLLSALQITRAALCGYGCNSTFIRQTLALCLGEPPADSPLVEGGGGSGVDNDVDASLELLGCGLVNPQLLLTQVPLHCHQLLAHELRVLLPVLLPQPVEDLRPVHLAPTANEGKAGGGGGRGFCEEISWTVLSLPPERGAPSSSSWP